MSTDVMMERIAETSPRFMGRMVLAGYQQPATRAVGR
jgi:hypothetical protein